MDVLGNIVTIYDLSTRIINYATVVAGADGSRRLMALEMRSVQQNVLKMRDLAERERGKPNSPLLDALAPLTEHDGLFSQLRSALEKIESSIVPHHHHAVTKAFDKIVWPYKVDDVKAQSTRINELVNQINFSVGQACIRLGQENYDLGLANLDLAQENRDISRAGLSVGYENHELGLRSLEINEENRDHVKDAAKVEELERYAALITPLRFEEFLQTQRDRQLTGTGEWFLSSSSFRTWTQGTLPVLWCKGGPGVGKTVLATVAYDTLVSSYRASNTLVIAMFCTADNENTHSLHNLISSMLRQAVEAKGEIPKKVKELYDDAKARKLLRPKLEGILQVLNQVLGSFDKVFMVLDGSNEIPYNGYDIRETLLDRIESLEHRPNLMLSSQPHPEIRDWLTSKATTGRYRIDESSHDEMDRLQDVMCDQCQRSTEPTYGCRKCDFDLCIDCYEPNVAACKTCGLALKCCVNPMVTMLASKGDIEHYIFSRINATSKLCHIIEDTKQRDMRKEILSQVQDKAGGM